VLLRPMGEGLVLEQLKHEEELRPMSEVPLDTCTVDKAELELAKQIIGQRTNEHFEPQRYRDEIRARILDLIEQKVQGKEISVPPEEKPEAKIIDLMEALKASVRGTTPAAGKPRKPARAGERKTARTGARTKRG
jgi:DNA end-binding protein Ku